MDVTALGVCILPTLAFIAVIPEHMPVIQMALAFIADGCF
jgi:hypothetical protein